jgi:quercetin dioxygenase-like cupin family protein
MATSDGESRELSFFAQEKKGKGKSRKSVYFDRTEMPEIIIAGISGMIDVPDKVRENVDLDRYFDNQIRVQPLLADQDNNGFSVGCYWFEPNFVMPRHKHDSDQVVLVVEGEMRQGSKVLKPGAGYFTPAGTPYGFTVGTAGCRIIEFRDRTNFETVYVDEDPAKWDRPGY